MNVKYYLRYIFWGLLPTSVVIFKLIKHQNDFISNPFLYALIANTTLFPFSRYAIEFIALKFTTKEFWYKGGFNIPFVSMKLEILYDFICYILAIPMGLLGIFITIKQKRASNT